MCCKKGSKKSKIEIEKFIYKIINKYSKILLLDKHTFEVVYGVNDENALMECRFNYPYLNVTILYGDKFIERYKKKDDLIPFIVHEICHPITDPLYCKSTARYVSKDEILDEREKLTDYICNIVIKNKL